MDKMWIISTAIVVIDALLYVLYVHYREKNKNRKK